MKEYNTNTPKGLSEMRSDRILNSDNKYLNEQRAQTGGGRPTKEQENRSNQKINEYGAQRGQSAAANKNMECPRNLRHF